MSKFDRIYRFIILQQSYYDMMQRCKDCKKTYYYIINQQQNGLKVTIKISGDLPIQVKRQTCTEISVKTYKLRKNNEIHDDYVSVVFGFDKSYTDIEKVFKDIEQSLGKYGFIKEQKSQSISEFKEKFNTNSNYTVNRQKSQNQKKDKIMCPKCYKDCNVSDTYCEYCGARLHPQKKMDEQQGRYFSTTTPEQRAKIQRMMNDGSSWSPYWSIRKDL